MATHIKDFADWAEDKFSSLCSAAGVTRNKSTQDRTGWDYLIEFPAAIIPDLPTDMQPGDISARVQVKSKRKGRALTTLKLSNALRFAKDPGACFVVLFLGSDGQEPVRIFARHFWKELIEKALHKGRVADVTGHADLHKVGMQITFGLEDDHTDDLLSWMKATLDSIGNGYVEIKRQFVQTVGMEDGGIHGTVSFSAADLRALIDHQIGLTPKAPFSEVTIKQRRFGIDAAAPIVKGKPTFASMRVHPSPCRIRVRGRNMREVWMDGELLVGSLPGLQPELIKTRVVADFIEVVIEGSGSGTVNLTFAFEDCRSLPAMRSLLDVLALAESGVLDVSIWHERRVLLSGSVSISLREGLGTWVNWFSPGLHCLEIVAGQNAPPELSVSIQVIEASWSDLVRINGLVAGTDLSSHMTIGEPLAGPLDAKTLIAYDFVNIGAWSFLAIVVRPIIRLQVDGLKIELACGEPQVVEGLVRRGEGASHLPELVKLYRATVRRLGAGALELFEGNFRAMMNAQPVTGHSPSPAN